MKALIYAHYEAEGRILPYVTLFLRECYESGYAVIFISTSVIRPDHLHKIEPYCSVIRQVDNIGYDFYAWKTGLQAIPYQHFSQVILANSSIIGPLFPLSDVFRKMGQESVDFWGLTESFEFNYHLQSYFLAFNSKILQSPAFKSYWDRLQPINDREQVIARYELQLTEYFRQQGFVSAVYLTHKQIQQVRNPSLDYIPHNATIRYPFELLALKYPFVKIQLLRDNPCQLDTGRLIREINDQTGYNMMELMGLPSQCPR